MQLNSATNTKYCLADATNITKPTLAAVSINEAVDGCLLVAVARGNCIISPEQRKSEIVGPCP